LLFKNHPPSDEVGVETLVLTEGENY